MKSNHLYKLTIKVKLHTSPLFERVFDKVGKFVKETSKCYIFEDFRVKKSNVMSIEEVIV